MSLIIGHVTGGHGHLSVLEDINSNIQPGKIVGLTGLNGAGKSTTIRHIVDLLEAAEGAIEISHLSLKKNTGKYRKQTGYIPEAPSLYEESTLRGHIEVATVVYDISMDTTMRRAGKLLETFRLSNRLGWFPANFSKGMKQKVMTLYAFLIEPPLYIIGKPFLGLDPLTINALFGLMVEMKREGAGILISTRILATVEEYCDRFVVLHNGEIRVDEILEMLRKGFYLPDSSLSEIYITLAKEQTHE